MAVSTRTYRRYMSGIASRLGSHHQERQHKSRSGTSVPYRRFSDLDLDAIMGELPGTHGTVRVWRTIVLHEIERNPAREYAPARGAEMWTLNGQTHSTRSDRHFANKKIGLEALVGHLLVEVELDGLSADAKANVVTTARHTRAQREIGAQLQDAIDQIISEDDQLHEWNERIREDAFRRAAEHKIAGLDDALRAFGLTFKRKRKVKRPNNDGGRARRPPTPLAPIAPLHEHPTDVFGFRMVSRETIEITRGRTASVQLEADAFDGYFDDPSRLSLQFVPTIGDDVRVTSRDSLEGGRMRIRMKAGDDAPLQMLKLFAVCVTPARTFTHEIDVEVVEAAPSGSTHNGSAPGRGKTEIEEEIDAPPQVTVHFKDREPRWPAGWTDETVGEYDLAGVAMINGDFAELVRLRNALPMNRQADITNVYTAPIAMTLIGLADAARDAPTDEETGDDAALPDHFRKAALRAAALSSIFAIRYMNKSGGLLASEASDDE